MRAIPLAGLIGTQQLRDVANFPSASPAEQLLHANRPLIIGHRGCAAFAPENTLPSFKLALDAGADLVELDYRHNRDDVPVVIHDATLDRTTDARKRWGNRNIRVDSKSADEIQTLDAGSWFGPQFIGAKVPLLCEALDVIHGSRRVTLIERKGGDASTLANLLQGKSLINKVVVIAFDWQFLRTFHELEPDQIVGALGPPTLLCAGQKPGLTRRRLTSCLSARWLDLLASTEARLIVWNKQVTKASVKLAHSRGLKVWVYTIDDPQIATRLVGMGVDGIITNNPVLMRKTLSSE